MFDLMKSDGVVRFIAFCLLVPATEVWMGDPFDSYFYNSESKGTP